MDITDLPDLHGSLTDLIDLIDAARTAGVEPISESADV